MGKGRILLYGLIFTACTINYIDRVGLSVSAPQIVRDFNLSTIELGYLFSAFLWSYLGFVLPRGVYVDRAGTRVSTASGIAIWSIAPWLTFAGLHSVRRRARDNGKQQRLSHDTPE